EDCGYWRVRGLAIMGADLASDQGGLWRSPITVGGSHHIELRQILASHTNRYYNEHAAIISGTEDILVEDVEVHDFFRSGFAFYRTNRATCRRCYGNSHEVADLPACPDLPDCPDKTVVGTTDCPKCSGDPERGDATFYIEHSNDFLCENCVSEGSRRGYHVVGGIGIDGERAGSGIRILESVSIGDVTGIEFESNADNIPSRGAELVDFVAIAPGELGVRIEDPDGLVLRHVTVVQPGGDGIAGREVTPERCLDGACSLTLDHVLVVGAGEDGIQISGPIDTWSVEWSNAFGSAGEDYVYPDIDTDAFDDRAGNARLNRSEAATLVGLDRELCLVYVPEESNMHDVAGDGLDIGANVTNLLIDGVASGEALWATDGAFPCGPDPAAPPPIAGQRCLDLAERTSVGTTACPAPAPRG
ncbi:MAG: hypothetical protein JKY37_02540, partial [Nannocystaceae bacterium]|nr:hypothetical protein [Nannocystaceae bacterium]